MKNIKLGYELRKDFITTFELRFSDPVDVEKGIKAIEGLKQSDPSIELWFNEVKSCFTETGIEFCCYLADYEFGMYVYSIVMTIAKAFPDAKFRGHAYNDYLNCFYFDTFKFIYDERGIYIARKNVDENTHYYCPECGSPIEDYTIGDDVEELECETCKNKIHYGDLDFGSADYEEKVIVA